MFTLIRGGEVYAPQTLGTMDILLAFDRIARVAPKIDVPADWDDVQVIEARGLKIFPGFIDSHVHISGGGGEGGPATRTPEIMLSDLTAAGITTVVGLLGADGVTRHMPDLLAKARALDSEGITAYIYTGAYQVPTRTITDNVRADLVLIDKVLGVGEIAIADHRSTQPSLEMLTKLAAEARVGGILGGKAGIVHVHTGEGKAGLGPLFDIVNHTDIPVTQFVPTHVNRLHTLLEQAVIFARLGGVIDLTAGIGPADDSPYSVPVPTALRHLLTAGISINNITVSSDGNGSLPVFDREGRLLRMGVGSVQVLWRDLRQAVQETGIPLSDAVTTITQTPAKVLKLYPRKGAIRPGSDADLVMVDDRLNIVTVIARGKVMVDQGQPVVFGTFEGALAERVRRYPPPAADGDIP